MQRVISIVKQFIARLAGLPRRLLIAIGLVAIVVIVGISSFAGWLINRQDSLGIITTPAIEAQRREEERRLYAEGAYDTARKSGGKAFATAQKASEDYEAYYGQAASYEGQADYKNALDYYQKAAAIRSTYDTSIAIAKVAEKLSNKQLAIDSYELALSQIAPGPDADKQKADLQNSIKTLRG